LQLPKVAYVHSPQVHSPQVHSPQVHSPQVHSPQVHSPQVHSPQVHSPQVRDGSTGSDAATNPVGAERRRSNLTHAECRAPPEWVKDARLTGSSGAVAEDHPGRRAGQGARVLAARRPLASPIRPPVRSGVRVTCGSRHESGGIRRLGRARQLRPMSPARPSVMTGALDSKVDQH
jgi:hypothetical protein